MLLHLLCLKARQRLPKSARDSKSSGQLHPELGHGPKYKGVSVLDSEVTEVEGGGAYGGAI